MVREFLDTQLRSWSEFRLGDKRNLIGLLFVYSVSLVIFSGCGLWPHYKSKSEERAYKRSIKKVLKEHETIGPETDYSKKKIENTIPTGSVGFWQVIELKSEAGVSNNEIVGDASWNRKCDPNVIVLLKDLTGKVLKRAKVNDRCFFKFVGLEDKLYILDIESWSYRLDPVVKVVTGRWVHLFLKFKPSL